MQWIADWQPQQQHEDAPPVETTFQHRQNVCMTVAAARSFRRFNQGWSDGQAFSFGECVQPAFPALSPLRKAESRRQRDIAQAPAAPAPASGPVVNTYNWRQSELAPAPAPAPVVNASNWRLGDPLHLATPGLALKHGAARFDGVNTSNWRLGDTGSLPLHGGERNQEIPATDSSWRLGENHHFNTGSMTELGPSALRPARRDKGDSTAVAATGSNGELFAALGQPRQIAPRESAWRRGESNGSWPPSPTRWLLSRVPSEAGGCEPTACFSLANTDVTRPQEPRRLTASQSLPALGVLRAGSEHHYRSLAPGLPAARHGRRRLAAGIVPHSNSTVHP